MKIVLDTNVLVSAMIKPQSGPARILRLVLQGELEIVCNESILLEYREVLRRPKFGFSQEKINIIIELLRLKAIKAHALARSFNLPDPWDEPFLEAALASNADCLITGNKKHFPADACKGQIVLTPKAFLLTLPS